jgi:hypothetical protein
MAGIVPILVPHSTARSRHHRVAKLYIHEIDVRVLKCGAYEEVEEALASFGALVAVVVVGYGGVVVAVGEGGESKNVQIAEQIDPRVERDRRAQLEAASLLGLSEDNIPIRGFGQMETRTVADVLTNRVQNVGGSRQVKIVANSRVDDLMSP